MLALRSAVAHAKPPTAHTLYHTDETYCVSVFSIGAGLIVGPVVGVAYTLLYTGPAHCAQRTTLRGNVRVRVGVRMRVRVRVRVSAPPSGAMLRTRSPPSSPG